MSKPLHLGLSIIDLSKTVMYEFWCDYLKPKYGENINLCYVDADSFIFRVKSDDIYKDIAEDVEERLGTSNYEIDRRLHKGENEKGIGLMKDELGGQFMKMKKKNVQKSASSKEKLNSRIIETDGMQLI